MTPNAYHTNTLKKETLKRPVSSLEGSIMKLLTHWLMRPERSEGSQCSRMLFLLKL